jgi:hypothetical protein
MSAPAELSSNGSLEEKLATEPNVSVAQTPANLKTAPAGSWTVLVQGVALFSDGYNVQIIGYMNVILAKL